MGVGKSNQTGASPSGAERQWAHSDEVRGEW